jgi:hypothetical protein
MTIFYNKKHFNQEELAWAITLIEAEYEREDRNTPLKMSKLIEQDFDVSCPEEDVASFFELIENYERESNRIQAGYYPGPEPNQLSGVNNQ